MKVPLAGKGTAPTVRAWKLSGELSMNRVTSAALIRRYGSLIYAVVLRYGFSGHTAEAAFVKAATQVAEGVREAPSSATDLAEQVARLASDACQAFLSGKRNHTGLRSGSVGAAGSALSTEVLSELVEQFYLRLAVEQLNSQSQELIKALYYQRPPRTHAEMAARLGINESDVRRLRAACLEQMMHCLMSLGGRRSLQNPIAAA